MSVRRNAASEARSLDILEIGEIEERAYRWLLGHPRATVAEIAQVLPLSPRKTQRLLETLEDKGLITHSPERPRRYIPAAPDIAMEALILKRQEDLKRARLAVQELRSEAAALRKGEPEPMVELLTSRESARQTFEQFHRTARQEIVSLIRLPVLISRLDVPSDQDQQAQRDAHARGVHYRSIVDSEFMDLPGAIDRMRSDMSAGEETRVVPVLPFKMGLADRRMALIPMMLQQSSSPVLLVRSSALLDALYALFEMLWERAAPISLVRDGSVEVGSALVALSAEFDDLIALLAAGLNDKAIAHELQMSLRTFRRRSVELMARFGARSRFQAGWLAALRMSKVS